MGHHNRLSRRHKTNRDLVPKRGNKTQSVETEHNGRRRPVLAFAVIFLVSIISIALENRMLDRYNIVKTDAVALQTKIDSLVAKTVTVEDQDPLQATYRSGDGDGNTRNKNVNASKKVHNILCNNRTDNDDWNHLCSVNFVTVSSQLLLESLQEGGEDVNIVQIGAHTGFEENDPIANEITMLINATISLDSSSHKEVREHLHWTFVEPSPTNFKRLSVNVKKHVDVCDMRAINAAVVSDTYANNGHELNMTFYSIRDTIDPETGYDSLSGKELPYYLSQISSFSKKTIMQERRTFRRHGVDIHDYIVEIHVTTKTYSNLMQEALVGRKSKKIVPPLLVLIDTEGFDCEIIKGISPSSAYLPTYLVYEHKHCDSKEANEHLKSMGYDLYPGGENTVAVKKVEATDEAAEDAAAAKATAK